MHTNKQPSFPPTQPSPNYQTKLVETINSTDHVEQIICEFIPALNMMILYPKRPVTVKPRYLSTTA